MMLFTSAGSIAITVAIPVPLTVTRGSTLPIAVPTSPRVTLPRALSIRATILFSFTFTGGLLLQRIQTGGSLAAFFFDFCHCTGSGFFDDLDGCCEPAPAAEATIAYEGDTGGSEMILTTSAKDESPG